MKTSFRHLSAALALATGGTAWATPTPFVESFKMHVGAIYRVNLRQNHAARPNNRSFKNYGYWGAEGAQDSFCISSFSVSRRGTSVRVAGKSFADLCNVSSMHLSERNGSFTIALKGGDAGDSFTAEFLFRGVYLVERMVRHGEFPEAYERTIYKYNTGDN